MLKAKSVITRFVSMDVTFFENIPYFYEEGNSLSTPTSLKGENRDVEESCGVLPVVSDVVSGSSPVVPSASSNSDQIHQKEGFKIYTRQKNKVQLTDPVAAHPPVISSDPGISSSHNVI